jgi:hypothetical protein
MSLKENIEIKLVDPHQKEVFQGQDVELLALIKRPGERFAIPDDELALYTYKWSAHFGPYPAPIETKNKSRQWEATLHTDGIEFGTYSVVLTLSRDGDEKKEIESGQGLVQVRPPATLRGSGPVTLGRSAVAETKDVALWQGIRKASQDLSFAKYEAFMNAVMSGGKLEEAQEKAMKQARRTRGSPFPGIDAYQLLKTATEVFVKLNCRVLEDYDFNDPEAVADYNGRHDRNRDGSDLNRLWDRYLVNVNGLGAGTETLPYLALIRRKFGDQSIIQENPQVNRAVEAIDGLLQEKLSRPCFFELIWSYWHEEGMLVQTLNAITVRFQNQRTSARDPLGNFMTAPLHSISSILFGYIQDAQHRLTVARRAYEYDHEYGITLHGKAVPALRAADSRSKFLEAFHNLLTACVVFYEQDDNTTIIADGFQLLNGLKEVHLLLAEGAHNQFGDLPTTARIEMLIQQWILARPEIREFIGGRPMVPYAEAWMDRVDGMKKLQNWTDVTITYFNDLARFGEQLLLSIRYGSWSELHEPRAATNWARDWRAEVKQYIHAYRAVTGIDLSVEVSDAQSSERYAPPSVHLRRRLELQQAQQAGPSAPRVTAPRRLGVKGNGGNGSSPPARNRVRGSREELEIPEQY